MKPSPGVNTKLRTARRKLDVLNRSVLRFAEDEPYVLRPYKASDPDDPSLHHYSLRSFQNKRLPGERWSVWVDEITYHLRSALDGLIYDLSRTADKPDPSGTGFPIAITEAKFDRKLIRYLTEDQRAFVQSVQPYRRPDDPLWFLHEMNRRNKHRIPRFTTNIVALDQESISRNIEITYTDMHVHRAILRAAIRAEDGAEFLHLTFRPTGPKPHVKVNMKLQIDIELEQWRLTGREPNDGLVTQAVATVEEIVATLYATP